MGDIESAPFIEAMRQFQFKVGVENFALVYVSLIPVVGGEQKTKPTQAGVRDLRGLGLLPDIVSLTLRNACPADPHDPMPTLTTYVVPTDRLSMRTRTPPSHHGKSLHVLPRSTVPSPRGSQRQFDVPRSSLDAKPRVGGFLDQAVEAR